MTVTVAIGLSIHAPYRCRDSGACCTAGWEIPVERSLDESWRAAAATGRLTWYGGGPLLVERQGLPPEYASVIARRPDGACVLHDEAGCRCEAHRRLGAIHKPISCRRFPWISVHDPRGTSVSLSHFCPTAAALLFENAPLRAVPLEDVGGLAPSEGLDVRAALPPALDARRLLDWDTLTVWERIVLAAFDGAASPAAALSFLYDAYAHLLAWTVGRGPMVRWLERFEPRRAAPAARRIEDGERCVREAIPAAHAPPALARDDRLWEELGLAAWRSAARPVSRYLAARSFACWPLHFGRGLPTQLRYIEAALDLVERQAADLVVRRHAPLDARGIKEAIRQADLWLLHLADPQALAAALDRHRGLEPPRVQ